MKIFSKGILAFGLATAIVSSNVPMFNNWQVETVYAADTKLAIEYQFTFSLGFAEGLALVYEGALEKNKCNFRQRRNRIYSRACY